jgi:hypothetical protein
MSLKNRPTNSDGSVNFWLWLIPITYLIHIAEEYWGGEGYSAHLLRTKGVYFSPTRFLVAQAIGALLMFLGVIVARWLKFPNFMMIVMATIVLVNSLTHTVNGARSLTYEPGFLSSVFIWLPLGIYLLLRFKRYVSRERLYWAGITIGIGVNVVIAVITMRGGRLF